MDCFEDFIFHADRLIRLIAEEGLSLLPFQQSSVYTPSGELYHGFKYCAELASVSIMRGGDAMEAGLRAVCKNICIGKMLIAKDPLDDPGSDRKVIYCKLPSHLSRKHVFLLDPILGTGKTAVKAIEELLRRGCSESRIVILSLVASSEAVAYCFSYFPQLKLVTSAVDRLHPSEGRVVPGLGEFADRYFGTWEYVGRRQTEACSGKGEESFLYILQGTENSARRRMGFFLEHFGSGYS
jgi:uridine kinase